MSPDWVVAIVLVSVAAIAGAGIFLGSRDPVTRRYKPGIGGLFTLGRVSARSPYEEAPKELPNDGPKPGAGPDKDRK